MSSKLQLSAILAIFLWAGSGISDGATILNNLVLDQIGDVSLYNLDAGPGPTPSQVFTDFPDHSSTILEDFTVTTDHLRITNVSALFRAQTGFSSFQKVDGYVLNIFSDPSVAASGLSGDISSLLVIAGATVIQVTDTGGNHEYGLVQLDVDILLPAAGRYWVGVSPVSASSVSGQFYLQNSGASGGTAGNNDARFANPGDGFGAGPVSSSSLNYAYSVTAVPEPGALVIQGLAGVGLLFRRKRGTAIEVKPGIL